MYSSSWLLVSLRSFISLAMFEKVLCISLMRLFFSVSKFACAAFHSTNSFCKRFYIILCLLTWGQLVFKREILEFFDPTFPSFSFHYLWYWDMTFAALFSNWLCIYWRTSMSFLMAKAWAGADMSIRSCYISFLLSSVKENLGFWPSWSPKTPWGLYKPSKTAHLQFLWKKYQDLNNQWQLINYCWLASANWWSIGNHT